jgi:hypothetical protein
MSDPKKNPHTVNVVNVNGRHKCDPTETHVNGGDKVIWGGDAPIFFEESPFEQGQGPFSPGSASTVKRGLPTGKRFKGVSVEGQIIIDIP